MNIDDMSPEEGFQALLLKVTEFYNELERLARKSHLSNHTVNVEVRGKIHNNRSYVTVRVQR